MSIGTSQTDIIKYGELLILHHSNPEQDEGRGGSIQFRPIKDYNYEPIEKLDLWCIDNLPKWSVKGLDKSLDTTLEIAVAELVEDRIRKGQYTK